MSDHTIKQGDYQSTLSGLTGVDLIFTSPPYNIGSRSARKDGNRSKGLYDAKSYGGITGYEDSLPESVYQAQQVEMLTWAASALKRDGVLVYNHKPRRKNMAMIHPMTWIGRVPQLTLMEEVIWDRGSTHNHSDRLFWPTTERLYVLRRTEGSYRFANKDSLRFRSDVWKIPLASRVATDKGHACPFALSLAEAVVDSFTSPGDLVCDPYSGSGTTGVAAKVLGRRFIGAERDKKYARIASSNLEMV